MAVVVVVGVVVVLLLRVCPRGPLALRLDQGLGHHLQPFRAAGLGK